MHQLLPLIAVSDHAGWAIAVAVNSTGQDGMVSVVDRCRIVLKADDLPGMPHHDESRRHPLSKTVAMVGDVRRSARTHSQSALEELALRLGIVRATIVLRAIPEMPGTVAECITDYWANARADGVMYRTELAEAALARGWNVAWFDKKMQAAAQRTPQFARVDAEAKHLFAPPWNGDHRLALAGALSTLARKAEDKDHGHQ